MLSTVTLGVTPAGGEVGQTVERLGSVDVCALTGIKITATEAVKRTKTITAAFCKFSCKCGFPLFL
jgi:hypothetical protein